MGCTNSKFESNKFVVIPDCGGSKNAAGALDHAVKTYRYRLTSVNKFEIKPFSEEDNNLLKNLQQYINKHFISEPLAVK